MDKKKKVYDVLVKQTNYQDSYEVFEKSMNEEASRKKVYDILVSRTQYKDSYEDYSKSLGYEATPQSTPKLQSATQPTTTTNVADATKQANANVTEDATQKAETTQANDATTSQNADGGSTERAMAKDSQGRYREVLGTTKSDNGWKYRSSDEVKREYDLGVGDNTVESQIVQWAEKAPSTEDPNEPLYLTSLVNGRFSDESIKFLEKHNPELYKNFSNKQKWKAEDKKTSEYVGAMVDANLDYFKQFFPEGWSDDHIKAYIYDTQIFGKTDNYLLKYVKDNDYHAVGKYITSGILGVKRRFGENTHRYLMTHDNEQSDFLLNVALWAEKEYGFTEQTNIPEEFKQMLMRTLDEVTKADKDGVTLMDKYDEVVDENGNKIKVSRGEIFVNKALAKLNTYVYILENIPNGEEREKYLDKGWEKEIFTDPWDAQQGLDEVAKANGYRLAQINIANNPEKLNSASEHLEELRKKANDAYGNSDKLEFALNATLDGYVPGTPNAYDLYLMEKGYYNPIEQTKLAIRLREEAQDMAEDAKSDGSLSRFWEGLKAGATDADLWTGGLSSVADGFLIRDVMEKYNADKENLTKEEEMLLDAFFTKLSVEAYTDRGIAYDVGRSIPESIGFMLSFLLSPTSGLAGGLTRKFAKWAIKKYGKGVIRANATKFALGKGLAYGVGSAANAGATSFTTGAGFTAKNISDELAKSYDPNEDKFVGDKKPLTAIAKGLYKTFNEVFVEEAGGSLLKSIFKPIDWGLGKISPTYNQSKELWEGFASGKGFKQFKAKTGFNGTPIEFGEEILTDIANLPISNDTFDADEQTGIFGTRRMVTTGLSCLAIGTMMNTPNAVTYQSESKRIAKYRENTNNLGSLVLGKKWEGIKSRIDNATPSEIEGVVMQEMMKGKLTTSQKKAILKYAGARVQQDVLLLRENELAMEAKASKVIDAQGTLNDKTKEGYNATDENEQRRMAILAQQSEQEVKAMLGENEPEAMSALNTRYGVTTAEDLVAKVVNDESLTPEQRNAILNYINTDASKHAIEKRMADDANALIMQAKREIDSYANEDAVQARNPNNVIEAKLKEDDSQVYVISGNLELLEDGTVNTKGSSESIVVFNPNAEDPTKQKVMTTPAQLYDVTKGNAQAMLDERVSQIKAEHQRKLTQVTTGERTFEINQQITIPTQDGQGVQTATITNITPGKNGSPLITYTSDVDGTTSQVTIPKAEVEQKMDEVLLIGNTPSVNEAPSAITAEPQISVPQAPVAEVEETKPIEVEDNVTFEVDGNQLQGVVASIEEGDGVAIVQTEDEKVHRVPLDNLTIVEETATKEQGGNNVEPTANATSEGSSQEILDNSNEVEQNAPIAPTESTPQAETPSESTSQDANDSKLPPLMGIPTDENGNKMYESASVEATINDIYNDPELDEEEADAYVQARIDGATKRVAELEKKKPKMGEDRDAYVAQRDTWRAEREAEQAKLDYWQGVQEARKNSTSSAESAEATPIEPSEESVAPIVEGVEDAQEESSDNQEEKLNTKEENIEEEEANIPMANESSMPIESTEEVEEIEISKATPQAKQSIKSKPGVVKNSQSLRLPKGQVKLLDRVAKALGVQIEFVPTMQGANAKIVGNKVTVALDAEQIQRFGADGVTIVIGHELTHRIKALSNEAFEDFAHIIESILPEQFKQLMINTRIAYSRQGLNISNEALREEVVADLAGLIMTDGNLMEEFLKELEPKSTKQQILDILKQMFNALKGVFQGKTARDLANAERVLLESMKKASAVVNEDNTTEANNASEKLSIIGESGASALDRAEEVTQRMDNLETARKMEKYDYPKKAIRMATGWERGADGKWRYEIEDDFVFDIDGNVDYGKRNPQRLNDYKRYKELLHKKNALAFDGEELNAEEKAEFDDLAVIWKGTKLHNSTRLKDYIDHPELFEAYPELRDVSISFDNINARGEYDSSANEITLSNTLSPNEAKSTLIHEIQHAIQKIEGFARGGNVEASKNLIRERNNKALIWSFQKNISHMAKNNPGLSPLELIDKVLARRVELTGDNIATLEEQGAIPNEDGRIKAYNLWARGYDNEGYENAYNMVLGDDAFEVYRRHAGEVESRNVQSRMGMTPDQRRATLLAETEDVARKDQIFLMENSGVSAMAEDANESVVDINEQEGQALFSLRSYNEGGRDAVQDFVNKQVDKGALTQEQANEIVTELEDIYNICEQYKDEYAPFGAWSDAKVVADERGVPVFSVIKKNGDYGMNLDFSLVCKKRRTLDAVFQEMINRGVISNFELGQVDIARINDIIREHGFETACRLCFVDSKRFRTPKVADDFANLYNELVEMSDAQLKKVIKGEAKNTVRKKTANHLLKHPEDRIKVGRDNFITAQGFEQMQVERPEILKLYNQAKGSGGPKASFGDTQYMNDIQNTNWTPEKAYAVGGVRLQSFSDYVPRMVFDYVQLIADLASKGLPVHAYTKEPIFAKQFGLTGVKINLSLVPRVDADGVAPGLDKDGNYAWQDGESFPYDEAVALQNAEGYKENVGTIAVGVSDAHIAKMLDDPNIRMVIPYHKSGLNKQVAIKNNIDAFNDYTTSQNTRKADGTKVDKKGLKGQPDFNQDVHNGMHPRDAAQKYLDWCDKKGYLPKFDQFRDHPNYYKLLEDFTTIIEANGVEQVAPQGAVKMQFPTENDAFGSMESLVKEGLEEDAILEGNRQSKVGDIVDEIEDALADTKYSLRTNSQEVADIVAKAKADGTYMKAPNGEPTNLTEEQWANVRTKAFKNWFGDWENDPENASKVVDENGEPMVVYHGSGENSFNVFEIGDEGFHFGNYYQALMRNYMKVDHEGVIKAFYINIKNPLVINADARNWSGKGLATFWLTDEDVTNGNGAFNLKQRGGASVNPFADEREELERIASLSEGESTKEMQEFLKSKGYDGIVYLNEVEVSPDDESNLSYIAFEPNQIKSATDNVEFGEGDDIRYSLRSDAMKESVMEGQPLFRDGSGALSDADLSYANDPFAKALGKSQRSKAKQAKFAERERKAMRNRVAELVEKLGIGERVELIEGGEFDNERKARAKGWYDVKSGKIVINLANHTSVADIERTLLHEAVSHHGLRELFGKQFDTFLDNVFRSADYNIRTQIVGLATRNGWDFRTATEEYLAQLAEDTNFDALENSWSFWSKIKQLFMDMLESIGWNYQGPTLTDNELRYLLWRSYENMVNPGRHRSILGMAEDVVKREKFGIGTHSTVSSPMSQVAEGEEAKYSLRGDSESIGEVNERFNAELQQQVDGTLPKGHIYQLGMPCEILLATGFPNMPIEMSSTNLAEHAKKTHHPFDIGEVKNLVYALQNPIAVFAYGDKEKSQNVIVEIQKNGRNFLIGVHFNQTRKGTEVSSVRGIFPKDNAEWLNWITQGKTLYLNKERVQDLINQQRKTLADVEYLDLNSVANVINEFENPTIDDVKYSLRSGDGLSNPDKVIAREAYERMVASGRYQFTEAMQDSMMGLKLLYKAILGKEMWVENIPDFENAYIAENLMSSQNAAMQQEYYIKFMKPLVKAINALGGKDKAKRQAIIDYMMAKHGLERNQVMAHRDAKALADEAVYGIQFNTESEKQDTWQKAYDKAYKENREVDYAGLTALTGTDKVAEAEAKATEMVEQFETDNNKDNAVTELWARVNDATKANLKRLRNGGVISNQQYNDTLDMYQYYIPLRGWDATTSDEVYAYLTSKNTGMQGSTMKGAKGRKSKADDPIATIGAMADSAIREANRNAMKQRFLNFVLNHPSDLVSVDSIWLQYDDVTNTWIPVFADIKAEDTPDVIEQKLQEFNEKMQQLRNENPGKYKHDREAQNIPYVVKPGMDKEHQVMVKRNGQTYILTINGNPRAAQALNGLTNPDVDVEGWIGKLLNGAEKVNRQLSAFYTTRNPDFVVSNFSRDMIYSNAMAWVKESPKYAVNFHANCGVAFTMLPKLLIKWERGTLDMNNSLEEMFYQFMINGGETGYTEIRDVEKHKRMIASELKKHKNVVKNTWHGFGAVFDGINRQIENTARFAAFKTSREMGRTVQRSAYDAKEISVNFNKKGSGAKMLGATGQTFWGDFGAWNSGLGRTWWVFWNAGVQGMTNFGKNVKRHPVKATALMSLAFVLGACAPTWNDDDDDDKKKYYLIPEYIRRSNICFRVWGDTWCTIPLPIELRAMYGLGELYTAVTSGGEKLSNEELAYAIAGQVSQVLPLDMLEGGGGLNALIPTAIKPIVEAYRNIGWHGGPIHREFYTSDMADTTPQWTLAYPSVSSFLMNFTKALNEWSGGENYEGVEGAKPNDAIKGEIDLNPAKIEYVLKGYFGGVYTTFNNIIKSTETVFGDRKFEAKNTPVYNRLFKEDDPEAEKRKYNKIFYKDKEADAIMEKRIKNAVKFSKGNLEYADKLAQLQKSDEYKSYVYRKGYKEAVKLIQKRLNYGDELINEEDLNARIDALKKEMAEGMESADNKSVKKLEIESAKRALKIDKDFKDVDAKQNEIKGKKRAEELKEQGASATKIKRSKGYYEGYKKRQTKEFDEREAEIRRMENEPEDLFDEDDYEEQGD